MKFVTSISALKQGMRFQPALLLTAFALLLASCSTPETVVVQKTPESASKPGEYNPSQPSQLPTHSLDYGETNKIESLDPLFAHNDATFRIIDLMYEGLVGLNDHGEVVPRIARSWDISADSLTYTFHLRPDIYFQDNEVFNSGRGRLIKASDVQFDLTRTAKNDVPGYAAELFMNIHGYDTYYKEQHQIFSSDARMMKTIPGIQAVNDTTIKITLDLPDSNLLNKLASPYAVVYPQEAVSYTAQGLNSKLGEQDLGLTVNPVGSGPFTFDHSEGDSIFVFVKNENYWRMADGDTLPTLDRVRVRQFSNAKNLFRAFSTGSIEYIPNVGPDLLVSLIDDSGNLKPGYSSKFNLNNLPGRNLVQLYYNPLNDQHVSLYEAAEITHQFNPQNYASSIGKNTVDILYEKPQAKSTMVSDTSKTIYIANTEDAMRLNLITSFIASLTPDWQIQRFQSLVISRAVTFYTKGPEMFYPGATFSKPDNLLLALGYKRYSLTKNGVIGLHYNNFPWWQDLTQVSISNSANP